MASQLPSLAAPAGLCLLSALAAALLVLTLYVLGAVASFAVFCAGEFARRDPGRPPLTGTMLRQLKNFDRLFDEHVRYALAHRTSRLVYPGHSELFTADPAVVEHVLRTNFSKYSKVVSRTRQTLLSPLPCPPVSYQHVAQFIMCQMPKSCIKWCQNFSNLQLT
jgi:hypothetical protein